VIWGGAKTGRVMLQWVEQDGPAVQSPKHHGFGFLVITELVARSLQGTAKLEFSPDGIRWQLEFPASHVLNKEEALT
jgi:two-component sensor histidine kinase